MPMSSTRAPHIIGHITMTRAPHIIGHITMTSTGAPHISSPDADTPYHCKP